MYSIFEMSGSVIEINRFGPHLVQHTALLKPFSQYIFLQYKGEQRSPEISTWNSSCLWLSHKSNESIKIAYGIRMRKKWMGKENTQKSQIKLRETVAGEDVESSRSTCIYLYRYRVQDPVSSIYPAYILYVFCMSPNIYLFVLPVPVNVFICCFFL